MPEHQVKAVLVRNGKVVVSFFVDRTTLSGRILKRIDREGSVMVNAPGPRSDGSLWMLDSHGKVPGA